jgi:5'-nucleotidase
MSGINFGQNYGPIVALSGTIGAARMAATRGIPAVAFSQDNAGTPQFDSTAKLAVAWLKEHRAQLAKKPKTAPTSITAYNVPNCPSGKSRGILDVVTATELPATSIDCTATGPEPTTDFEAFNQGYAARTQVPLSD